MIKYKVKDVASDLGVQNKEITEILEKYCGVNKKTMASLDESELDVIFDVMTKKNNVENFDSYFAARNEKLDGEVSKPAKSEKPEKSNNHSDRLIIGKSYKLGQRFIEFHSHEKCHCPRQHRQNFLNQASESTDNSTYKDNPKQSIINPLHKKLFPSTYRRP